MKKYLLLATFAIFIFNGCADKSALPLDYNQTASVRLHSKETIVLNKSREVGQKILVFSDNEIRFPWFNEQMKKEVEKVSKDTIINTDGTNKIIVNIEQSDIYCTMKGIKTIPFVGILALGMEEDVVASVTLLIEVEDANGKVIASTPIRVQSSAKSTLLTEKEVRETHSVVMSVLLRELQKEIVKQVNRALYNYLAHNH